MLPFLTFSIYILVVHKSDKKYSTNKLLKLTKSRTKLYIRTEKSSLKDHFLMTRLNSSKGDNQICGTEPYGNGNSIEFTSNPLLSSILYCPVV